jgi:hypothetical protein
VADSRETQTRERAISNEERYERAREQGVDFSKEELGSKLWADTQDEVSHFNKVFDTMEREDPRRYAAIQEFIKDSPYRQDLMGMEGARADRPMLIFHSGKYLDMEKMGYSGVEAGQFLAPKEIGMHGGNLNQSAIFANAHQKVLPQIDEAGNIVRVYAPNTYGGPGTNLYEQIEQTSSWIDSQMPSRFKADYNRIRRSYAQQYLYSMVDDPSDVGKLKRPQIGEMIVEELKALDGWVDDPALEQAIMSVEASRYSQAGTVMYPLVFRGRRPFRMLDLVQNDVRNQAQSALKWQGWTPRQRANLELLTSRQLTHADATKAFRETLEEAGFDHIIYVNQNEEAGTPSVIFWDQSLVKPLYGSRGFDRNSDKWVNSVLASPLFGIGEQEGTDGGN